MLQAIKMRAQGDYKGCLQPALQAAALLPLEHDFLRVEAAFLALRVRCHLEGAQDVVLDALLALFQQAIQAGDLPHVLALNEVIAKLWLLKGKPLRSYRCCEQALDAVQGLLSPEILPLPVMASLYIARGEVAYQQDRLEQAIEDLSLALELAEQGGLLRAALAARVQLSRAFYAKGEVPRAKQLLEQVERVSQHAAVRSIWDFVRSIQLSWQFGQRQRAEAWCQQVALQDAQISTLTELSTPPVLARIFLAQEQWSKAEQQIQKALETSELFACNGLRWKGTLLRALLLQAQGQLSESLQLLLVLLREAQLEHVLRLYADEGPQVASLLSKLLHTMTRQDRDALGGYIRQLLEAFRLPDVEAALTASTVSSSPSLEATVSTTLSPAMYQLDPLSERELEVLASLAQGGSNKEIAQVLHISLSTAKTHIRRIYSKLGVKNRTQAIQQARQLQILEE
ncbi:MAG: hypothetical protein H6728_01940 [Myxococcales bacterium]|nr:hypothetical protein [Myxococcales bacterium]MCB9641813.1 hypothetical protein [Myxococcales bacterium]